MEVEDDWQPHVSFFPVLSSCALSPIDCLRRTALRQVHQLLVVLVKVVHACKQVHARRRVGHNSVGKVGFPTGVADLEFAGSIARGPLFQLFGCCAGQAPPNDA